jgi:Zn-dependent peptidase ImmA (M78 family)
MIKAPILKKDDIELIALRFIKEYEEAMNANLLENAVGVNPLDYLDYLLDKGTLKNCLYKNIRELFPEIPEESYGCIEYRSSIIYLDTSLEESDSVFLPFTAAHELAHFLIHKPLCDAIKDQLGLPLIDEPERTTCFRSTIQNQQPKKATWDNHDWLEWQANYCAGCLQMPSESITKQFHEHSRYHYDPDRLFTLLSKIFHSSKRSVEVRLAQLNLFEEGQPVFRDKKSPLFEQ